MFVRLAWLLSVSLLLCLSGCGGPSTTILKGKISSNGQPIKLATPSGQIEVVFWPLETDEHGESTSFVAEVNEADGTFESTEPMPIGKKYRVSIQVQDPYPLVDKLGGKFYGENSKVIREVPAEGTIEIDVSRPEG